MNETKDDRDDDGDGDGRKPTSLAPGTKLGVYRIEGVLGEGAMGWVYCALHDSLARKVAIKALKPQAKADSTMVDRFLAEARAVNIIRHENIVECTDTFTDDSGEAFVVMELLDGQTLRAALREAGRMPPGRAVRIAIQIARAIGAAHAKDIVHRDLKPENVFLIRRGDNPDYVKVLDFGIARLRPELGYVSATQTGALMGTPAYMSPEQVRGERATAVSDIYALGIIVFELVAGRGPFEATNLGTMFAAHLVQDPKRLEAIAVGTPKPLADLVARMLAKPAEERPQSMADVEAALERCQPAADAAVITSAVGRTVDITADTVMSIRTNESIAARRKRVLVPVAIGIPLVGAGVWLLARGGGEAAVGDAPIVDAAPVDGLSDGSTSGDGSTSVDGSPIDAVSDAPVSIIVTRLVAAREGEGPTDPFQRDRARYDANTRAIASPKGTYGKALHKCYGMQRKLDHELPRTKTVTLQFSIDANGKVVKAAVDGATLVSSPKLAGWAKEHVAGFQPCLVDEIRRWFFAPALFEHTSPLEYTLPFELSAR